jgi:hypothetical protein
MRAKAENFYFREFYAPQKISLEYGNSAKRASGTLFFPARADDAINPAVFEKLD